MLKLNEFKSASNVESIFTKLFESRDFAHKKHLETKSFAQHKALGSFYEDILDLTDSLIESYQGKYGIQKIVFSNTENAEVVTYFEDLARFIVEAHSAVDKKDSYIHNQLDSITQLVYSLLYKLKNLK